MITINKEGKRPSIQFDSGINKGKDRLIEATNNLLEEYNKHKNDYDSGKKIFDFKKTLYAHPNIKQTLIELQENKCCFCESKVTQVGDGDVEHFRPKAAYKQKTSDKLQRPGYFWLAYDWDNLFLACAKCNQRNKKNLFPLIDEQKRAKSHLDNLFDEQPYFIHPEFDSPENHITFDGAFIKPKNDSKRGKKTILELALTRTALFDTRREIYDLVKALIGLYQSIPQHISETEISKKEVREQLKRCISPKHIYSGMIKANFGATIERILRDVDTPI